MLMVGAIIWSSKQQGTELHDVPINTTTPSTIVASEGTEPIGSTSTNVTSPEDSTDGDSGGESDDEFDNDMFIDKETGKPFELDEEGWPIAYGYKFSDDFKFRHYQDDASAIYRYTGNGGVVHIPRLFQGRIVRGLEPDVFIENKNVEEIFLGDYMEWVSSRSMAEMSKLTMIVFGKSFNKIDSRAIYKNPELHTIVIQDGMKDIRESAIFDNPNLKMVGIPSTVTLIGDGNFENSHPDLVIYGEAGSVAEEFSKSHGITFKVGNLPCDIE